MTNEEILKSIKGGLIVSCQALPEEPLHSSFIMGRMAYAAWLGGAKGIRANTPEDIAEIRKTVPLPVIGIVKKNFENSEVYITPTVGLVDSLVAAGCEIIAIDATFRPLPDGRTIREMFPEIRAKYPDQLFMADCASYENGIEAAKLGFDLVGTTLYGYTRDPVPCPAPNYELIGSLVRDAGVPVIAEGGIWSPAQLRQAMDCGVHACVVGSAITRPYEITKRFAAVL
ncbi:MAG: N-acetylmannosamine-6-phosphate 2-epimerase [Clostridia bacterium]|nr:N-acetylmannosamine-6-phosphate 2-epimerase [Clostridia bacterium]